MMSGLAGLVRSKDWIWVTKEALAATDILLPYDDGRNEIGWVDLTRCGRKCPTGKHAEIATDNSSHDTNTRSPGRHLPTRSLYGRCRCRLTSLKEKLIKIGAKVVSSGRYVAFQMAEVAIPKNLFADILRLIAELRPPPATSTA